MFTATTAAALTLLLTTQPSPSSTPQQPDAPAYRIETVASNLEIPWSIDFLPDGRILFTERPGRVRLIDRSGDLLPDPIYTVPGVMQGGRRGGEIGLMDLCLHPNFESNRLLYLSFGHTDGDVRVVRYRWTETPDAPDAPPTLSEDKIIIKVTPAAMNHAGCRMGFGPDGKLYITTGEAFRKHLAQDMTSLAGKTLRLNDDGSVPDDNPFVGRDDVRPEIWSYGHRNAQGIDWHPVTGRMYQTEHGPSISDAPAGGDEFNLVQRGDNLGWPIIHHDQAREGLVSPLVEWTPAIAPASGVFYRGDAFPNWRNSYLLGALGGLGRERRPGVYRLTLSDDGTKVTTQEVLPETNTYGRIREVAVAPDGTVYFSTSNRDGRARPADTDDRILRLVPTGK